MKKRQTFLLCGVTGWCLELIFTGLLSAGRKDFRLKGTSSLWMFPIYGMAACIGPVSKKIQSVPIFLRGCFYMTGIFGVELASGSILKHFEICPWDYSKSQIQYKGLIRADYAPLWFLTGLFFEKILKDNP